MIDWEARAKLLDTENETLREENRQLKKALLGASEPPPFFGFTKSEATIFSVLIANRAPRPEAFMSALFSTDADDPPDEKILDVWICKMRKKLKPFGIEIKPTGVSVGRCQRRARLLRASLWRRPDASARPYHRHPE